MILHGEEITIEVTKEWLEVAFSTFAKVNGDLTPDKNLLLIRAGIIPPSDETDKILSVTFLVKGLN